MGSFFGAYCAYNSVFCVGTTKLSFSEESVQLNCTLLSINLHVIIPSIAMYYILHIYTYKGIPIISFLFLYSIVCGNTVDNTVCNEVNTCSRCTCTYVYMDYQCTELHR